MSNENPPKHISMELAEILAERCPKIQDAMDALVAMTSYVLTSIGDTADIYEATSKFFAETVSMVEAFTGRANRSKELENLGIILHCQAFVGTALSRHPKGVIEFSDGATVTVKPSVMFHLSSLGLIDVKPDALARLRNGIRKKGDGNLLASPLHEKFIVSFLLDQGYVFTQASNVDTTATPTTVDPNSPWKQ